MGLRWRLALLVGLSVALIGGYLAVDSGRDEPAAAPSPVSTTAAEEGAHDHHCPDAGTEVDGRWSCEVTNARLVSQWPFDRPPTDDEQQAAASFAERVEASARRFGDVDVARAAGYAFDDRRAWQSTVAGTPLEASEAEVLRAGTIAHLVNAEHANDGIALDPDRPDALMYATDGTRYVLVGAMFLAPYGTDGPQIGGPLTTWHVHTKGDVVCWDGTAAVGFARLEPGDDRYEPSGGCERGRPLDVSPQMLHVWFDAPTLWATFNDEMSDADAAARVR